MANQKEATNGLMTPANKQSGPEDLFQILNDADIAPDKVDQMSKEELKSRRENIIDPVWDKVQQWLGANKGQDKRATAAYFRRDNGVTSLHLMCKLGKPRADLISEIIEAAPEVARLADATFGWLPLHYACRNGVSSAVLEILIKAYPEGKLAQDTRGCTPLHLHFYRKNDNPDDMAKSVGLLCDTGAAEISDEDCMLPIHLACGNETNANVVEVLADAFPESLTAKDNNGRTPMHHAMENCLRDTAPDVLKFLLDAPAARETINLEDEGGNLPLHWMATSLRSPGIDFKLDDHKDKLENARECLNVVLKAKPRPKPTAEFINALDRLPSFLQQQVFSYVQPLIDKDIKKTNHAFIYKGLIGVKGIAAPLLSHLLEIGDAKERNKEFDRWHRNSPGTFGNLAVENLNKPAMIQWLNRKSCNRKVIFFLMIELYLQVAWMILFVRASKSKLIEPAEPIDALLVGLSVVAVAFLGLQFRQFWKKPIQYFQNMWNSMELVTVGLVIASVIELWNIQDVSIVDEDHRIRDLLIATGCFIFLSFISYLKKTFYPFAMLVGGVIRIFWNLIPFLVVTSITLFAFAYMYFVQNQGLEGYETLGRSFLTVFDSFVSGRNEAADAVDANVLDVVFGIVIVVVLLNVVIAIVGKVWDEATTKAARVFWQYRFGFFEDVGLDEDEGEVGIFKYLDELELDFDKPVMESLLEGFSVPEERDYKDAVGVMLVNLFTSTLIVLGFCTAGLLFPMFIRQMLFCSRSITKETLEYKLKQMEGRMQEDFRAQTTQMEEHFLAHTEEMGKRFVAEIKQMEEKNHQELRQLLQRLGPPKDDGNEPQTPTKTDSENIDDDGEVQAA
ncbi:unnamed protein product [Cylindrotheca closterium]|uniref:Ion transport domain-containing protein n=1 Tax=Cylindrotheca closterium TaxID=2856 RepID=A0AAD2G4P7_9STRA|nr:unnamed protein product [Cylindrotheca closterium]